MQSRSVRRLSRIKQSPWWSGGRSFGLVRQSFYHFVHVAPQCLPGGAFVVGQAVERREIADALVNGVGIAQVAELLGHTSTEMVMKHYSHIAGNVAHMREAAVKAANAG
ncbi:MAG: hypothetical protein ACYC3I_16030 [Gemmataceae bacterium]